MTATATHVDDETATRIHCSRCGKSVSSPVPKDTLVRAWVECPECIEAQARKEER